MHDFIFGLTAGYFNTLLFYPSFTIIHSKFHKNYNIKYTINRIYNKNGIKGFYSGISLFSIYIPLVRAGEFYFQKKFVDFSDNKTLNIGLGSLSSNIWKF